MLTRRNVVAGGGLLLAGCATAPAPADVRPGPAGIKPRAATHISRIEGRIGGRVGVCAIDTATMVRIGHRQRERFAMASTFKWLLAAGILKRCQSGGMQLESHMLYRREDLLPTSPVSEANIDPETGMGRMTLAQMCEAVVTVSDNCAANLLLVPMFGPEGLTRFFNESGDSITRLDRPELELNENAPGDERDTTTPEAMALTAARLLTTDEVLNANSREMLIGWMRKASTGLDRLRGGLPAEWNVGDKTGTGGNGAHNDVAIAFPPGRKPIVIASYLSESSASNADKAAAHAEIARIVAKEFA
jgi:beta-lactamase class A